MLLLYLLNNEGQAPVGFPFLYTTPLSIENAHVLSDSDIEAITQNFQ